MSAHAKLIVSQVIATLITWIIVMVLTGTTAVIATGVYGLVFEPVRTSTVLAVAAGASSTFLALSLPAHLANMRKERQLLSLELVRQRWAGAFGGET